MRLHLRDQRIMYRASMTRLETHLNPAEFARTHRSTIVRLDQNQTFGGFARSQLSGTPTESRHYSG